MLLSFKPVHLAKSSGLGFGYKYKADKNFRSAVKMIPALAFLPTNTVKRGISIPFNLSKTYEELEEILVYFDSTYVNGTYKSIPTEYGTIRLVRRPPIFSPYMWNVYNATKEGYGRTNNVSEGFNNKFKNIVRIRHPNIYIFIESLQMCNASAVTALLKKK
uniref:Transposase IS204/IS1001/IS1096/IS1165 DDE domain-containing protein n=1 Tax=Schizaphis graminum TaxID=13262 RepID=A0A2S2NA72_SCHGA